MHKLMTRAPLALSALCLFATPALATDMPKPAELTTVIQAAAPYGASSYDFLAMTVYDAALWTDAPEWSMQAPFALSLRYEMDVTSQDFADKSIEQMNDEKELSRAETETYRPILLALLPSVKSGDTLTALYTPGTSLRVYHNGQLTGETTNMDFAARFIDIWLSDRTSAPRLRRHLLRLD
jgi:hypothetical protein